MSVYLYSAYHKAMCICYVQCPGYHEVPMEPRVPNKPVQNLITDESASGTLEPRSHIINSTVMSNVTMTTADELTVLMSSAIISIMSTLASLFAAILIFRRVSDLQQFMLHLTT